MALNRVKLVTFINIYNPGQNTCSKIEKSSKTEQDKKSLISAFAFFFTAITKV